MLVITMMAINAIDNLSQHNGHFFPERPLLMNVMMTVLSIGMIRVIMLVLSIEHHDDHASISVIEFVVEELVMTDSSS